MNKACGIGVCVVCRRFYREFKEVTSMARNNQKVVPEASSALDRMKYEVAGEIGINLKQGYNGDILAKDAGHIGGQMVRRLIQQAENSMKGNTNMGTMR